MVDLGMRISLKNTERVSDAHQAKLRPYELKQAEANQQLLEQKMQNRKNYPQMVKELPVLTCEEVGFSGYVERYEGGTVIKNDFSQQKLNASLKNLIKKEKLSIYKKNLSKFKENNYLFSRFEFIASLIERELNV